MQHRTIGAIIAALGRAVAVASAQHSLAMRNGATVAHDDVVVPGVEPAS